MDKSERRRLDSQSERILGKLKDRPQTNVDLAQVALKYTSRISDLRAEGYNINCQRLSGGLTLYTLA